MSSIESMMASQQGRELMAEVLRAVANVLSKPLDGGEQQRDTGSDTAATGRSGDLATARADEATAGRSAASGTDAGLDAQLPLTAADDPMDASSNLLEGSGNSTAVTSDEDATALEGSRGAPKKRRSPRERTEARAEGSTGETGRGETYGREPDSHQTGADDAGTDLGSPESVDTAGGTSAT
jgi:hypothetical protein